MQSPSLTSDPNAAPAVIRHRRREKLPRILSLVEASHATASPPLRPRAVSEGPTIRGIRVAFEETPVKLRELEEGWRQKRRAGLAERQMNCAEGEQREREQAGDIHPTAGPTRPIGFPSEVGATARAGKENMNTARLQRTVQGRLHANIAGARTYGQSPADAIAETHIRISPHDGQGRVAQLPTLAPPSPPPTPPIPSGPAARRKEIDVAVDIVSLHCIPAPILSAPLPPTTRPVRLTSRSTDTIYVHPAPSSTSITLSLRDTSKRVTVSRDGRTVEISSISPSDRPTRSTRTYRVSSDNMDKWSEREKRDWEVVRRIVERYKCNVPKVKLYLPLGQMVVTCSSPPDIILTFDHPQDSVHRDEHRQDRRSLTRVLIRYSRLRDELAVDTSCTDGTGTSAEKLRTRRVISIPWTGPDDGGKGRGAADVEGLAGVLERTKPWTAAEREGVRRLWESREEWTRYG